MPSMTMLALQSLVLEVHSAKPVLISVVERPISLLVAAIIERAKGRGVSRDVRILCIQSARTLYHTDTALRPTRSLLWSIQMLS